MRKKKWMMRWQASLMPDPSMIPDATVFRYALQHNAAITPAIVSKQSSQQSSSQTETNKKRKRSKEANKQPAFVVEETFIPVEGMVIELDPAIMSFLQEEEIN